MEFHGQQINNDPIEICMDPSQDNLKQLLAGNRDIVFREIYVKAATPLPLTLAYTEGVADSAKVSEYILRPLVSGNEFADCKSEKDVFEKVKRGAIYYSAQVIRDNAKETIEDLFTKGAVILFNHCAKAVTFDVKGYSTRPVAEPSSESILKGPKDSFVESLSNNTATIRNRLKSPNLEIEEICIGRQSSTKVALFYMKNITNDQFVELLRNRLKAIDIADVFTLSQITDFLLETKYTAFPQMCTTERPDKTCADLTEGCVAFIAEGIPFATTLPTTLASLMQSSEDYSMSSIISSITRVIRYILMFFSLYFPGIFLAMITFHQEMIPAKMTYSLQLSGLEVPFSSFIQIIVMLVIFESLFEIGLRLPRSVGQAVSIIASVVIGQAAVQARILSGGTLVVVALAIIFSFVFPNKDLFNALRLWRILLTLGGGVGGILGVAVVSIFYLFDICRIEMFGIPFIAPIAGAAKHRLTDSLLRSSFIHHKFRPEFLKTKQYKKEGHPYE